VKYHQLNDKIGEGKHPTGLLQSVAIQQCPQQFCADYAFPHKQFPIRRIFLHTLIVYVFAMNDAVVVGKGFRRRICLAMAMAMAMAVAFAKGRFVFANYNRSWLDEERHRIEDYEATQTVRLVPHNQTHIQRNFPLFHKQATNYLFQCLLSILLQPNQGTHSKLHLTLQQHHPKLQQTH
jgi:hypothetical protein